MKYFFEFYLRQLFLQKLKHCTKVIVVKYCITLKIIKETKQRLSRATTGNQILRNVFHFCIQSVFET